MRFSQIARFRESSNSVGSKSGQDLDGNITIINLLRSPDSLQYSVLGFPYGIADTPP